MAAEAENDMAEDSMSNDLGSAETQLPYDHETLVQNTTVPTLVSPSARELLFEHITHGKALVLQKRQENKREFAERVAVPALLNVAYAQFYLSNAILKKLSEEEFKELCVVAYNTSRRIALIHGGIFGGCVALMILSWFIGPTGFTLTTSLCAGAWLITFLIRIFVLGIDEARCEDTKNNGVLCKTFFWRNAKYIRFAKYFKRLSTGVSLDTACRKMRGVLLEEIERDL
ncbi:MAG: hypothetical protein Q8R36_02450 [bacterium]|nr:hypothetical protein [bacterium]